MIHAIDVGSTTIKYICFATDGTAVFSKAVPFPQAYKNDTPYFEVRVSDILVVVTDCLKNVSNGDSILISVQMHGYILLNRDGRCATEYISWRDTRASLLPEKERFDFELPPEAGVGKKNNLPRASLRFMQKEKSELFESASEFCTLGSFLAKALCGENASHITDCAPTGFYDSVHATQYAAMEQLAKPKAYRNLQCIGTYRGADIYTPVGDQQSSVMGSNICADEYLLNIGTAAQVCCINPSFIYGNYESRPYFGGRTLCTVTGLIGGGSYCSLTQERYENAVQILTDNYAEALLRLPKRNKLRAIGGAFAHYGDMLERVLNNIGLPWTIDEGGNAAEGLYRLWIRRNEP